MPYINYARKEIQFKIVYFGPSMSGKTTNLLCIYDRIGRRQKGDLVVLDSEDERTLFFDYFPLDLGSILDYQVRFNLYTVPGQIRYDMSRRIISENSDGIIFVADSNPDRFDNNLLSFTMMQETMQLHGIDPEDFPFVLQYNKRDCKSPITLGSIESETGMGAVPVSEAIASRGIGVMETVHWLCRAIIEKFKV